MAEVVVLTRGRGRARAAGDALTASHADYPAFLRVLAADPRALPAFARLMANAEKAGFGVVDEALALVPGEPTHVATRRPARG